MILSSPRLIVSSPLVPPSVSPTGRNQLTSQHSVAFCTFTGVAGGATRSQHAGRCFTEQASGALQLLYGP